MGRVDILGVGFDRVALVDAVAELERRLDAGDRTFIITANPEFVMLCRQDREVAAIARRADLVVPDGTGVVVAAAPDVVLVAFGMPKQERWIARNLDRLPSARVAVGIGGSLDYLAGAAKPPPPIVHAIGLEWLWRLVRDPRRWRRQRVLPAFAALVLLSRIRRG